MGDIPYRGTIIRYEHKKYIAYGVPYDTFEEAKKQVDIKRKELQELIKKQNPHIVIKNEKK